MVIQIFLLLFLNTVNFHRTTFEEKEQYYINLLKPEYNILKVAGSRLGHKHTDETRVKMAAARLGKTYTGNTS